MAGQHDNPPSKLPDAFSFGRFTADRRRREIHTDGMPLELGGRNFDLLIALIEARGEVVSKDDLMSRVWPRRIVEESNLQAGISVLRKALGADRDLIRTVAGRGYQFTGAVHEDGASPAEKTRGNLPASRELVCREGPLTQLGQLLFEQRLVTLCGAGGIGKTRLAIEAARRVVPKFPDGVWLADLAPLTDPALVPVAVASALGLPRSGVSAETIADAIASKHLLLVLDNCEHLIDAAARLAELVERKSGAIRILCTSREPLKVATEWVYYVPSLEVPQEHATSLGEVLATGAAQLFVLRARQAHPDFTVMTHQASALGAICRRLDGMPLSIELAAARVAVLGLEEVAARLDDRFRLLAGGNRTALPRHQTLRATLDWSYELLAEPDRAALCRLSVFAGAFSLEAATALLADQAGAGGDVIDQVASLVEKSLLTVLHLDAGTRYRMLETTRSYAQEKLVQRGEMDCYSRRHAEHLRSVLKRAAKDWETLPEAEWAAAYCALIDDARVTLNWALTRSNDPALAAELAVAMVPLWLQRSHLVEWRTQVERALAMVLAQEGDAGSRHEMQLRAALGGVLHSIGGASAASDAELRRALELAESLGDSDHQLMTVMGLTVCRIIAGDCRAALPLARQYCALVESRGRPAEQFQSHNFMSYLLSWMGDQAGARRFCDLYKARPPSLVHRISTMGHQYDHRNTTLGRVLWLEGHAEQALRFASDSLEEVLAAGHPHAICALLATMACPIALLSGRLDDAERYARLLQERALKSGLSNFPAWGRGLEAAVQIERGVFEPATSVLAAAVEQLRRANIVVFGAILVAALAKGLQGSGRITEALSVLDDAIEQAERMEARWYLPEQWRIKGELLLAEGRTDAARRADEWFGKSLELSRSQGSLSWELRTAMSRARLLWKQEQPECASQLLQSVMARFTEGWDTADLVAAAALMESLQTRTRIRRP